MNHETEGTRKRYGIVYAQVPTDKTLRQSFVSQMSSQVRAEPALGATRGGGGEPSGEAEKAPSGALNMLNIAVFRQSASKSFISLSRSHTHLQPISTFQVIKKRDLYFYKEMYYDFYSFIMQYDIFSTVTYRGSSVSSTEKDIDTRLTKAWTAIDKLSIIWKSNLTDKMKRSFFQAAVVSILLYGWTTWTLTKRLKKKLDGNYTRMLRAILNKSWQQHPTRHQLYGYLPPITKLYKLDEQYMQDTTGKAGTSS